MRFDAETEELLTQVQQRTWRYFWDGAHPTCGLALDRIGGPDTYGADAVALGGSGFGLMALPVAVERGFVTRRAAFGRAMLCLDALERAERHHGLFPHLIDGRTGRAIAFSPLDDGADLVESAYLFAGLLTLRQYFGEASELVLRQRVDRLWVEADWAWHTRGGADTLYWHWSPHHDWAMNFPIVGWNECLIAYVLGAASASHPIPVEAYHRCWAAGRNFRNGKRFHGITLPLGPDFGGSLCFAQYSFLGLDPRGLQDQYADYWQQNVAQTLINRAHCIANPLRWRGYGADCWGLTASDDDRGYHPHDPLQDCGVISPTASLSSLAYAPREVLQALHGFRGRLGPKVWGECGFVDAFCETRDWYASSYLAIDQGPILLMLENARSGLLWRLLMSCPEIGRGLHRLGITSPRLDPRTNA
jgi:hypothetical protein